MLGIRDHWVAIRDPCELHFSAGHQIRNHLIAPEEVETYQQGPFGQVFFLFFSFFGLFVCYSTIIYKSTAALLNQVIITDATPLGKVHLCN